MEGIQGDAMAIVSLFLQTQILCYVAIVDDQRDLRIQDERADIHIAGPDDAHAIVDVHVLSVKKVLPVQMDPNASLQQFLVIRALPPSDKFLVAPFRHDQMHLDTSKHGNFERLEQRFIRDKIGCSNDHPFPRL